MLETGSLTGKVTDNQSQALPGVRVMLTGGYGPPQDKVQEVQVTDVNGKFTFIGLQPGYYAVKAELEGFSVGVYTNIVINLGINTTIGMILQPAISE